MGRDRTIARSGGTALTTVPAGIPEGWVRVPTQAFGTHVGPFYRPDGNKRLCGFVADERHGNKRGVTHGGMLATAFDIALGNACWDAAGERPSATIQLNIQYVGALQLGEFATVQAEIIRTTRSLVFVRGVMMVGDRVVATGEGIWKVLAWRGEPYVPPPPPAE
jgi:acyl-coenzyme A thioesterase PaaI-like protein